jgi:prenyl protein peptidase
VILLYLVPPRRVQNLPRSSTEQILWRFVAVAIAMVLAPLPLYYLKESSSLSKHLFLFDLLGVSPRCNSVSSIVWPVLVTATLFLGPIVAFLVELVLESIEEVQKKESINLIGKITSNLLNSLNRSINGPAAIAVRSLIVAPFAEEWSFRACTIPIIIVCCGFSASAAVFFAGLSFALAHVHHYLDHVRNGMTPEHALREILLQLSYTSVFGALEAVLFLQTGSYFGIVLPHIFCNFMGVPNMHWIQDSNILRKQLIAFFFLAGIISCIWLLLMGPLASLGLERGLCILTLFETGLIHKE